MPDGAKTLTLPQERPRPCDGRLGGQDPNADAVAAQPLYDQIDHAGADLKRFYASSRCRPAPAGHALAGHVRRRKHDPVFQSAAAQTFAGAGDGAATPNVAGLPKRRGRPWTINQFVYLDKQPDELTLLGGIGNATDDAGARAIPDQVPRRHPLLGQQRGRHDRGSL